MSASFISTVHSVCLLLLLWLFEMNPANNGLWVVSHVHRFKWYELERDEDVSTMGAQAPKCTAAETVNALALPGIA